MLRNKPTYITTNTTTHIAALGDETTIHTVIIPKTTSGTVTFQSLADTPVVYFVLPTATIAGSYLFDCVCGNGLDVVTSASDVVIVNSAS
ncbi:MAG: hypothetical protein ACREGC_00085 [Minisyncoccia bacterium]